MKKTGVIGMVLLVGAVAIAASGCSNGTIPPNTQQDIVAAEQLGACIEGVYATDSQKVPAEQPLAIAIDEADTCGADVADLVNTLVTGSGASVSGATLKQQIVAAAQANKDMIHAHVLAFHQNAKAAQKTSTLTPSPKG